MSGVHTLGIEVASHKVYDADRTRTALDSLTVDGRRWAAIDPEDREQVERLLRLYDAACRGYGDARPTRDLDPLTDALREFASPTPPKPEEPQGLGAVVEDDRGRRWTRAGDSHMHGNWLSLGSSAYTEWDEIKAVRVLSEGVTS